MPTMKQVLKKIILNSLRDFQNLNAVNINLIVKMLLVTTE